MFKIDQNTGDVTFKKATQVDYDSGQQSYSFTVRSAAKHDDDAQTQDHAVTLNVTNSNDSAPEFTSPVETTLTDGKEYTAEMVVYTAKVPDVANGKIVYRLKPGVGDKRFFEMDKQSGEVTFKEDTTLDHDAGKTSYSFTVIAKVIADGRTQKAEQPVILSVQDTNDEAPVFISPATADLTDGKTYLPVRHVDHNPSKDVVYTAQAKPDVTGDDVLYNLNSDAYDEKLFQIDQSSGAVTFKSDTTPDHDADKTNYRLSITATVGEQTAKKLVTLSVADTSEILTTTSNLDEGKGVYLIRAQNGLVNAIDVNKESESIASALSVAGIRTKGPTTVFADDIVAHYETGVLNPDATPAVRTDGKQVWAVFTGSGDKMGVEGSHIYLESGTF